VKQQQKKLRELWNFHSGDISSQDLLGRDTV